MNMYLPKREEFILVKNSCQSKINLICVGDSEDERFLYFINYLFHMHSHNELKPEGSLLTKDS
jgi:hypothetical protein